MTINQIAEAYGKRVNNLWYFDDIALSIFAAKVRSIEQSVKLSVEPVTDEENEQFSNDVSNFAGADPEATKYALERFLKRRANTTDVSLLTDDDLYSAAVSIGWNVNYMDDSEIEFARAIEQLVRKKSGLK